MTIRLHHIVLASAALSLTGCFTGIESTPKITAKDVVRQNVTVSAEAEFGRQLEAEPTAGWEAGRKFLVVDPKLSMLFEREPRLQANDIIIYEGIDSRISISGDSTSVITFAKDGQRLRFPVNTPLSRISAGAAVTIPMTVDMSVVENARALLKGKSYYLLTPLRVNSDMTPIAGGRKYIKVTITDVAPGNGYQPLRIDFEDEEGVSGSVAMTLGGELGATRNFDSLFSFTDPRLRHPSTTDSTWALITDSQVAPGMTTDECRLAIGAPRDVRTGQNGSSFFEQWTYDNGAYCIFTDGLLTSFRL